MKDRDLVVSVVKIIQLRVEWIGVDGRVQGYNKKFQKPGIAADHWARDKIRRWEDKTFSQPGAGPAYHTMSAADHKESRRRFEILKRRATRVFKRMIA